MSSPTVVQVGTGWIGPGPPITPATIPATPCVLTFTAPVTAGNTVIVYLQIYGTLNSDPPPAVLVYVTSMVDDAGNTYAEVSGTPPNESPVFTNDNDHYYIYACENVIGAPKKITVNMAGTRVTGDPPGNNTVQGIAIETNYSGGYPTIDQCAYANVTASSSSGPWTGPSITITAPNELLLSFGGTSEGFFTFSAGSGWSLVDQVENNYSVSNFSEQETVASVGSYAGDVTLAGTPYYGYPIHGGMFTVSLVGVGAKVARQPNLCINT